MPIAFLPTVRGRASVVSDRILTTDDESTEQRLLTSIACELGRTGYQPLRRVNLQCESELVTIRGQVPSYFLKQVAQVTVLNVPGVARVNNQLRVSNGTPTSSDLASDNDV